MSLISYYRAIGRSYNSYKTLLKKHTRKGQITELKPFYYTFTRVHKDTGIVESISDTYEGWYDRGFRVGHILRSIGQGGIG